MINNLVIQGAEHRNINTVKEYFGALHLTDFKALILLQILRGFAAFIQKWFKVNFVKQENKF